MSNNSVLWCIWFFLLFVSSVFGDFKVINDLQVTGLTNCTGVKTDSAGTMSCGTGGGGTPGNPLNSLQYNSAGSFAGTATGYYDAANGRIGIGLSNPTMTLETRGNLGTGWNANGASVLDTGRGNITSIVTESGGNHIFGVVNGFLEANSSMSTGSRTSDFSVSDYAASSGNNSDLIHVSSQSGDLQVFSSVDGDLSASAGSGPYPSGTSDTSISLSGKGNLIKSSTDENGNMSSFYFGAATPISDISMSTSSSSVANDTSDYSMAASAGINSAGTLIASFKGNGASHFFGIINGDISQSASSGSGATNATSDYSMAATGYNKTSNLIYTSDKTNPTGINTNKIFGILGGDFSKATSSQSISNATADQSVAASGENNFVFAGSDTTGNVGTFYVGMATPSSDFSMATSTADTATSASSDFSMAASGGSGSNGNIIAAFSEGASGGGASALKFINGDFSMATSSVPAASSSSDFSEGISGRGTFGILTNDQVGNMGSFAFSTATPTSDYSLASSTRFVPNSTSDFSMAQSAGTGSNGNMSVLFSSPNVSNSLGFINGDYSMATSNAGSSETSDLSVSADGGVFFINSSNRGELSTMGFTSGGDMAFASSTTYKDSEIENNALFDSGFGNFITAHVVNNIVHINNSNGATIHGEYIGPDRLSEGNTTLTNAHGSLVSLYSNQGQVNISGMGNLAAGAITGLSHYNVDGMGNLAVGVATGGNDMVVKGNASTALGANVVVTGEYALSLGKNLTTIGSNRMDVGFSSAQTNLPDFHVEDGKVGVGTSTPQAVMDINGAILGATSLTVQQDLAASAVTVTSGYFTGTSTGGNAGTTICIDLDNRLCRCGSCK